MGKKEEVKREREREREDLRQRRPIGVYLGRVSIRSPTKGQ
jgi:hypothetical protein